MRMFCLKGIFNVSKYFLSICAVLRNESFYFAEWANFHRLQGVEHFYLYHNMDNGKDMATARAISLEGQRKKDITYRQAGGIGQQCKCYDQCLKEFGAESEWIAFIDIDEFLWAEGFAQVSSYFKTIEDPEIAGVAAHWLMFGSNGNKEKTDELVIERFTRRAAKPNNHVKSICRPAGIECVGPNPHEFRVKEGFRVVNERGVEYPSSYANSQEGVSAILKCSHYHTKSYQEFVARKSSNPDANSGRTYSADRIEIMFEAHDLNEVEDTELRDRYAPKIKEILAEKVGCGCR